MESGGRYPIWQWAAPVAVLAAIVAGVILLTGGSDDQAAVTTSVAGAATERAPGTSTTDQGQD
ncbi:MAG: hypothetical protein ACHQJ5_09950, partial [Vicinamibacteria bacterium]